jgi:ABC-2 type transport system ATP-binding protein
LAVDDLSFEVRAGEAVGFLGPNGAGKTTTMRLLTGFLPADAGRATVFGVDVAQDPLSARRKLGYLPEDNPLYDDMEVTDSLQLAARLRGLTDEARRGARVREALKRCGLKPVIGKRVWELSKGFRQRLGLAQAIVHDPEALVLDEPTAGLDPNQMAEVRGLIAELKARKTVLLSTHQLSEAQASCDRLLVLHRGRVVADGAPDALRGEGGRRALRVSLKAPRDEARRALSALPGAAAARDDGDAFLLESEADLREAVGALAAERRWTILHLSDERPSLEAVFARLTGGAW